MNKTLNRVDYLDNIKALACVLVVLGHFIMSMDASNIVPYNSFTEWFKDTIYLFHVQLFFLCSGFLYIFSVKRKNNYKYPVFVANKLLALGVPYFVFSTVTVLMKKLAGDSVNTQVDGLLHTLFIEPTAPYWYLYVLFFMFLIIPPIKSKKGISILLAVSFILKIVSVTDILQDISLPYFITGIFSYSIWFVLGMALCVFDFKPLKHRTIIGAAALAVFTALSAVRYHNGIENKALSFVLGLIAVIGIFLLFSGSTIKSGKITQLLIKYNLPIFLMHTIFAAGIRVVLAKIGLNAWYIQVPCGLIATFAGPAIAAFIMNKTKYLEIFLYPTKLIKINKE